MIDPNRPAPIVMHINIEEIVDGAWCRDNSLLPALSSKGESPFPEEGGGLGTYRRTYEAYLRRFTESVNRVAARETPGQDGRVEAGDVLRPWDESPTSPFGDPLFDEALEQTLLPTRDEITRF